MWGCQFDVKPVTGGAAFAGILVRIKCGGEDFVLNSGHDQGVVRVQTDFAYMGKGVKTSGDSESVPFGIFPGGRLPKSVKWT